LSDVVFRGLDLTWEIDCPSFFAPRGNDQSFLLDSCSWAPDHGKSGPTRDFRVTGKLRSANDNAKQEIRVRSI